MQKKRLEDALNAGRLIDLGFNLNYSKPTSLNLLYHVNCLTNQFVFESKNNDETNQKLKEEDCVEVEQNENEKNDKEIYETLKDDLEKVEILCLKFNPNSNLLVTGDSNGDIELYDVFSTKIINKETMPNVASKRFSVKSLSNYPLTVIYNMPTICIKWYPYSNYSTNFVFFASVNGHIGIFDTNTFDKSVLIEELDEIACIDFNNEGTCFATCGKDSLIKLYDSNYNDSSLNKLQRTFGSKQSDYNPTNKSDSSLHLSSHSSRLQAVKFSDTSNDIFYTGGWDRTVKMWDKRINENGAVNSINGPFICGSDAIDVKDNLLLTASWVKENSLDLWDVRNCKRNIPLFSIFGSDRELKQNSKGEYLYACKFFSSTSVLACGSGTQSIHLLDYQKPVEKQKLFSVDSKSPLYCLDSNISSNIIACGGMKKFFVYNSDSNQI